MADEAAHTAGPEVTTEQAASTSKAIASSGSWSMVRIVAMSWAWAMLVDFLWIPLVARCRDLALGTSFLGLVFACNLGARLVPNLVVTRYGVRSELAMMSLVLLGYLVSLVEPNEPGAFYIMGLCSGLGFVRACLTMHPKLAFGQDEQALAKAARLCGSARNLGTITALTIPVAVYERLGWRAVCLLGISVSLLYLLLAAIQHSVAAAESTTEQDAEKPIDVSSTEPAHGEHVEATTSLAKRSQPIPWIYWIIGAGFVVTELQFNMCNAAVPVTLTRTFGLPVSSAGTLLALFNGASMLFLGSLTSLPCAVLHRSPFNIVVSFGCIFLAWCAAVLATAGVEPLGVAGSLGVFGPGVLLFLLAAYLAQVLMLEALTGVLDMEDAKVLMGVAETGGCAFAVAGGYLGDRLEEYGAAAPFAMQAAVGFVSFVGISVCLGHRRITTTRTAHIDLATAAVKCVDSDACGCLGQSFDGLIAMARTPCSFIKHERRYLAWRDTQARRHVRCSGGSTAEARKRSGGLTAPLLPQETPDVAVSSASAGSEEDRV